MRPKVLLIDVISAGIQNQWFPVAVDAHLTDVVVSVDFVGAATLAIDQARSGSRVPIGATAHTAGVRRKDFAMRVSALGTDRCERLVIPDEFERIVAHAIGLLIGEKIV